MKVQPIIEAKLRDRFQPEHLEVINESGNHNVPPGSESHFRVVLISSLFEGKPSLARHRLVNQTLAEELAGGVHALALQLLTPEQWQRSAGVVAESPPCANKR